MDGSIISLAGKMVEHIERYLINCKGVGDVTINDILKRLRGMCDEEKSKTTQDIKATEEKIECICFIVQALLSPKDIEMVTRIAGCLERVPEDLQDKARFLNVFLVGIKKRIPWDAINVDYNGIRRGIYKD